ncbi:MAG: hypothetical protein ACYTDT_01995 [Planctomycetota bacterium]|jgi:type III restriction enzyme
MQPTVARCWGHVVISATERIARDLAPWQSDTGWEQKQLVSWLCSNVSHHEQPHLVMAGFINGLVDSLIGGGELTLDMLVRDRFRLRDACIQKYAHVKKDAIAKHGKSLFGPNHSLEVNPEVVFDFMPDSYAPDNAFAGPHRMPKHYFLTVGDMNKEEAECAFLLDSLDCVKYWVRNLERKPTAFSLPMQSSTRRFYPDFLAILKDGRVLVLEYKGGHIDTADEAKEKRKIGELYEELSEGKVVFRMVGVDDYETFLGGLC